MATERIIYECPNSVCGPTLKAGPCFCGVRRGDRITYASREAVPVVPAVLSGELLGKTAKALALLRFGPFPWGTLNDSAQAEVVQAAATVLRAAGFVSEPSTGGDDASR